MTRRYLVDAFATGGQRVASETIEADASDTALHRMSERHPKAASFAAEKVKASKGPSCGHDACREFFIDTGDARCGVQNGQAEIADYVAQPTDHEGAKDEIPMWEYRRYLEAVRDFMLLRAEMGERPSQTLGGKNGAWAHQLMDRLLEVADDPARCRRETERLESSIKEMRAS